MHLSLCVIPGIICPGLEECRQNRSAFLSWIVCYSPPTTVQMLLCFCGALHMQDILHSPGKFPVGVCMESTGPLVKRRGSHLALVGAGTWIMTFEPFCYKLPTVICLLLTSGPVEFLKQILLPLCCPLCFPTTCCCAICLYFHSPTQDGIPVTSPLKHILPLTLAAALLNNLHWLYFSMAGYFLSPLTLIGSVAVRPHLCYIPSVNDCRGHCKWKD